MTVVLDAAAHPPRDRSALIHEAIASSGARRRVRLNAPSPSVTLRAEAWRLGPAQVLRTAGTGLTLERNDRDIRRDAPEMVAVALSAGPCSYSVCDTVQHLPTKGLVLVDFHTPYVFRHEGARGSSFAVHVPHAELGLSAENIRAAIPRLPSSPLYPLLRQHLLQVSAVMDVVTRQPPVAENVGAATLELIRASIVSATDDHPREREILHDSLRARIVLYMRSHLREHDLSPDRIAGAHHISRRTLYAVWGHQDGTLADWIIRERLDLVHRALSSCGPNTSVFAVARQWGFVDPTHFGRRFRAAYGVSPRDFVRRHGSTQGGETDAALRA